LGNVSIARFYFSFVIYSNGKRKVEDKSHSETLC